jgi:hypothetical protein
VTNLLPALHKPLIGAEVGVAEGNFSRDMLAAGMTMLFMVDNWARILNQKGDASHVSSWHDLNYQKAQRQTLQWSNNRKLMKGLSVEVAAKIPDESLSLVYLDADHSYEGVMADLKAWFPKLVKGGVMAGHDYLNPDYGVQHAVKDFIQQLRLAGAAVFFGDIYVIPENNYEDASFYFIKE